MNIVNLAGYYFVELNKFREWRAPILERCIQLKLKGSILLAPEGINLFVAGTEDNCKVFLLFLQKDPLFEGILTPLKCQISYSNTQPFNRMLVKLKKEIIAMHTPTIQPSKQARAPAINSSTLVRWLNQGKDDSGKEIVLLDTRNAFEVDLGTFNNAIDWRLKKFSDFPKALNTHKEKLQGKTIVTFCTGGIRCEKAALLMQNSGMTDVYQLDGGILQYFAKQGGKHYRGDCFVFDYRTALTKNLLPSGAEQCFGCRAVVDENDKESKKYIPGKTCPHCFETYQKKFHSEEKRI